MDVCTDHAGHVLIANGATDVDRIYILDLEGKFMQYFETSEYLKSIDVDKEGYCWVGLENGYYEVFKYLK